VVFYVSIKIKQMDNIFLEIVNFLKNINATKKQFEEITIFSNLTAIDRIKDANANKFNNTKRNLEIIQKEISQLIDNINYANEQVEAVKMTILIFSE
jgi:hypothetical protein